MQKKNPSRSEQAHLKKAAHSLVDVHSQNTVINISPLNRYNFSVKYLLKALVNAGVFLIAKSSSKISEGFENNFFFLIAVEKWEFKRHQMKASKSHTISVWSYQKVFQ